jgi:hemolysin activation/secretion protein
VTAPNQAYKADRISLYPSKNVFVVGGGYRVPLYSNGDSVEFSAGYSNVNSGTVANLFTISGSGSIFGARYNHNLDKRWDIEHKLTVGLDWRGYRSAVTQIGVPGNLVPDVTVHPISLTYAGNYRRGESDSNFYLTALQNLPGGNDGGTRAFQGDVLTVPILPPARQGGTPPQGANPRYFATRWGFNHNRALPRDWQFRFGMSGQMTRDKLVAGEQFGIGGADSVRGFLEREISNDNGYRGTFEFYTPDFGNIVPASGARLRGVVFYDWGAVRRIGPLSTATIGLQNVIGPSTTELHGQHIGSAGVGVRLSRGTNLSFRLDVATVTDGGGLQKIGDVRVHSSFAYIF